MIPDNSTRLSEREVFAIARAITQPQVRAEFLEQVERQDNRVAERVRRLLNADAKSHSLLDVKCVDQLNCPVLEQSTIPAPPASQQNQASNTAKFEFNSSEDQFLSRHIDGYEIEAILGRGGMSVVYQAKHLALKRVVALKLMLVGVHASQEQRKRFRVEAEAIARLQHPNIVQIHEVDESGDYPYCALEYVAGETLADKLSGKPLPAIHAAKLVETLARAMQLAHSRNVVHRDLKPANIMITIDGIPKITDFGLARQLDQDSGTTRTGVLMGTPSYMAPEQASGRAHEAGPPADVYALGAILYECLTGRPPFEGKTLSVVLDQVVSHDPVSPSRVVPGVPIDLETICLTCLRKEPENRYPSALELAEELSRFQKGEPIRARPITAFERSAKWLKRHPGIGASIAIFALTLISMTAASLIVADQFREMARQQTLLAENEKASRFVADQARNKSRRDLYHAETTLAMRMIRTPGSIDRIKSYLDRWADIPENADLLGWEWNLAHNLAQPIATSQKFSSGTMALEFSPDGKSLVIGDHGLGLLDSVTMQTQAEWDCATSIKDLRWEPAGSRLAISSQDRVTLFDMHSGTTHWQQPASSNPRMIWDPSAKWVAYCDRRYSCQIADSKTGQPLQTLHDIDEAFTFSLDGKQFIAAVITPERTHNLRFWRTSDWSVEKTVPLCDGFVYAMCWSPDGKSLAIGTAAGEVILVDPKSGTRTHTLESNGKTCERLAWQNDGRWLAVRQSDGTIRVWECASWMEVPLVRKTIPNSRSLRWRPTGQELLAGSEDGQLRLWALDQTPAYWTLHFGTRLANTSYLSCAWHPSSRYLAASADTPGTIVWGVDTRRHQQLKGVEWQWSSDANYSATVLGEFITVWDSDGKAVAKVELPGQPKVLAWQPNSHTLAIRTARRIHLWKPITGKSPVQIFGEPLPAEIDFVDGNPMAWSPDGKRLAFGEKTSNPSALPPVKVMDVANRSIIQTISEGKSLIRALAWSPDGQQLCVGCDEPIVKIYDVASGKEIHQLAGHGAGVFSIAWHPHENRLVTGSADETVKVWDSQQLNPTVTFDLNSVVRHVSWSPDGRSLAAAVESGTVHVWNSSAARPVPIIR